MPYGSGLGRLIPSFTYQPVSVAENVVQEFEGKFAVDIGAGGRRIVPWVKTVDKIAYPGTDYVCDFISEGTPFEDASVDLVIATGVLEHVDDDVAFIEEVRRILKPDGTVHIEMPFMYQFHADPSDYRRFTLPGIENFLTKHGFKIKDSGVHIGPTVAILMLNSYYIDIMLKGNNVFLKSLGTAAFAAYSLLAWPARYLDRWLIKKPDAHRIASGVYATATKIDDRVSATRTVF